MSVIHRTAVGPLFLLLAAATGAAAAPKVEDLIPADVTAVLIIRDAPETAARWRASGLGRLWQDPEIRRFFGPLRESLEMERWDEVLEQQIGYDLAGLLELFPGGVALYVEGPEKLLPFVEADQEGDADWSELPLVLLAGAGERAADLEALMLELERREAEKAVPPEEGEPHHVDSEREYRDVTLRIERRIDLEEPRDEISWAVVDGIAAIAANPTVLEQVVNRVLDGPEQTPLLASAKTAAFVGAMAASDIVLYTDLGAWVPLFRLGMERALTEGANPLALDARTVITALGLDGAGGAFLGLNLEEGGLTLEMGLDAAANAGVYKLMALAARPAPRPGLVPAHATAFGSTVVDLETLWAAVQEIANGINPMLLPLAANQLQQLEQRMSAAVDLRRDLLENLTGEMITVQVPTEAGRGQAPNPLEEDQVVGFGIRDPERFTAMVEAFKSLAAPGSELFTQREYLGHTVWTLAAAAQAGDGQTVAYTVTDRWAFLSVGSGASLEALLIAASREGRSAWERPEVAKALSALPEGAAAIQYQDSGSYFHTLLAALAAVQSAFDDDGGLCDPEALPGPEVPARHLGPIVSSAAKQGAGIAMKMVVLPVASAD